MWGIINYYLFKWIIADIYYFYTKLNILINENDDEYREEPYHQQHILSIRDDKW